MVRLERSVNRKKAEKLKQTVYKDMGTPTEQFIAVLAQRKVAEAARQDVKAAMDNHLALKISLVGIPEVWRRFRVPAATSLAKLHDHVLTPIMGWSRSYHGFSRKCSCRKSRRGGRAGVVFFVLTQWSLARWAGGRRFFFLEAALRSFFDKNRLSTKT